LTLHSHLIDAAEISLAMVRVAVPARRHCGTITDSSIHPSTMIRLGSQIRLPRSEVQRFAKITDIEPVGIRTLDDLDAYIARCKAHYWGVSKETRFLHWLIDREVARCRRPA